MNVLSLWMILLAAGSCAAEGASPSSLRLLLLQHGPGEGQGLYRRLLPEWESRRPR